MRFRASTRPLLILTAAAAIAAWASGCATSTVGGGEEGDATDGADLSVDGDVAPDAADPGDADAVSDADDAPDTGGGCRPNNDGVIERREVSFIVGLEAKFDVATDAQVDLLGETLDGVRVWDLVGPYAGDETALSELRDPAGTWFAPDFPDATYYSALSATSDLLGVFEVTDDALFLLGVVSRTGGLSATSVAYDPPVTVLRFPLREGDAWQVETSVTGSFNGFYVSYSESYRSLVDAVGRVKIPFQPSEGMAALRVRTDMDRGVFTQVPPYYYTTQLRAFAFVTECFGTVASVTSQEDEAAIEFSDAAEVRRFAP